MQKGSKHTAAAREAMSVSVRNHWKKIDAKKRKATGKHAADSRWNKVKK